MRHPSKDLDASRGMEDVVRGDGLLAGFLGMLPSGPRLRLAIEDGFMD